MKVPFPFAVVRLGVYAALLVSSVYVGASAAATPVVSQAMERKRVDLDARIKVETRSVGGDGVTRMSIYEDTLIRRGTQVWTQRVLGKVQADHDHASEGRRQHKHLNAVKGGRLIDLDSGKPVMTVIVPQDKVVVSIPSAEFANLGFDGSWERAYFLVTARELKSLQASNRKSAFAEARWYERKGEIVESVLWDEALMLPRVIESSSRDGAQWRRVTVTPASAMTGELPWLATQGFDRKIYADYLD